MHTWLRKFTTPIVVLASTKMHQQVGVLLALLTAVHLAACTGQTTTFSGRVTDPAGRPVAGATVRARATDFSTTTAEDGSFKLELPFGTPDHFLTAGAPGFAIAGTEAGASAAGPVVITLFPHTQQDNPDYAWQTSLLPGDSQGAIGCASCHQAGENSPDGALPVDDWLSDAHSRTLTNPRFLTMYLGTDIRGNAGPPTRYVNTKDYGIAPLRPEADAAYFGPGYRLDFPETAGNCAACHAPAAAADAPHDTDPTRLTGVPAEGIPCDFCHKVFAVRLDPQTGLPHKNMPGVLSFELRRPEEGHQFFAGPFDDVAAGDDVHSPLQDQGQFCAPCHFGSFWDVVIYDSFGEWLRSPYSDPETGQSCQDCHMPKSGTAYFALPEKGGLERDPDTIFSHRMPGASDVALLQNAVSMTGTASFEGNALRVEVTLLNDRTGHAVPTDSPLRHLILLVSAENSSGSALVLHDGPRLPDWLGLGSPLEGNYAGMPGVVFAKVLAEQWTNVSPTAAYWNPTYLVSDNRLVPFEPHRSTFLFDNQPGEEARIMIRLVYRRAFIELARQKGWPPADILMEELVIAVAP